MAADPSGGTSPRAPRQARGRERRDSILDAAAAIITESGLDAVSMHAAAQRAGASIGSVYHFFRDKEQLIDALSQRHHHQLTPMFEDVLQRSDAEWASLSSSATVEQLIGWVIRYFVRHPDALVTLNLHDRTRLDSFRALLKRVMCIRLGDELADSTAAAFDAVSLGTLLFTRDQEVTARDAAIAALPDVLIAYLTALELRHNTSRR
jgi:AcrR family transcriptional regulator